GLSGDMSWGVLGGGIGCEGPALYVDGRRDRNASLDVMSTYTIGAVETYYNTHGAPDFALDPDAMCGVIAVWTNRWRGRTRELGGGDVELCEPVVPGTSTVEGVLRDEFTDVILPGARVVATLVSEADADDRRSREIVSDPQGRYRVCDVPPGHRLYLKPIMAAFEGPDVQVPIDGPVVARDFTLRVAGPGQLVGRVLDRQTGRPVSTARVTVRDASLTVHTDEGGYFAVDEVLPGDHVLEVEHVGFEPVAQLVSVVADRTVEARVELSADPIELEPLVVSVLWDRRLELRGYYERRRWGERTGSGSFLEAEAIDRLVPAATSSLLRQTPGVEVRCSGSRSCSVRPARGTCSEMDVFINGARALGPGRPETTSIDELVRPSEIAALEVYPAGTSVPGEFLSGSGRCGAVVIWTR
ncbi:MAG: carboxypeptidase regulatory-like domain-containing protein, partial [Gemmatimonadota bacterium]|nr:carboxypeptidase regulatory-like domain-containing protein [Gemmatimonadota bacterium]